MKDIIKIKLAEKMRVYGYEEATEAVSGMALDIFDKTITEFKRLSGDVKFEAGREFITCCTMAIFYSISEALRLEGVKRNVK